MRYFPRFLSFFVFIYCLAFQPITASFSLTPIDKEFSPQGRGSTQIFYIDNPQSRMIAVQLSIAKRTTNELGKEVRDFDEGEEHFLISPAEVVIPPRKRQVIKISWIGEPQISKELSYRLIAEELPIKFSADKPPEPKDGEERVIDVDFLFTYVASLYITKDEFKPHIVLKETKPIKSKKGKSLLQFAFENTGTKHEVMSNLELTIRSKKNPRITPVKVLQKDIAATINVLPSSKAIFSIPWPEMLPKGPVEVSYDFRGKDRQN